MSGRVEIWTDGACSGNPGPGGWGAILLFGGHRKELSGGEAATTNNRMELTAAIEALKALKEPCEVQFHTDSKYVQDGMRSWMAKWKTNGWKSGRKPVKNQEFWKALDAEASRHKIVWNWVRGHSDDVENERCDQLANRAMDMLAAELGPRGIADAMRGFQSGEDALA